MKKRAIKIVKHDAPIAERRPASAEQARIKKKKAAVDTQNELIVSVKGWISERVENSKAADLQSESDRLAWEAGKPK
ncbi:MAG: hypothetical protein ABIV21_01870 [Pyrinomonadaceae bacterium]